MPGWEVAPGTIATDFSSGMVRDNPEINKRVAEMTALGRAGLTEIRHRNPVTEILSPKSCHRNPVTEILPKSLGGCFLK
jgi:hypothetical protein